jgi:Uncharacterized conserved protein (DUF2075)
VRSPDIQGAELFLVFGARLGLRESFFWLLERMSWKEALEVTKKRLGYLLYTHRGEWNDQRDRVRRSGVRKLDWVGVCWDADFRYRNGIWDYLSFRGTRWQHVNTAEGRLYLKNAYRVILTRARQGMIIFVPKGAEEDPTHPPAYYDQTYEFLKKCGLRELA